MMKAHVRHILVPEEKMCRELKERIANGEEFSEMAHRFSHCPSGHNGGDLGEIGQGQMVPQFDDIAFRGELNKVHGPVRTEFGCHLIQVLDRGERRNSVFPTLWKKIRSTLGVGR